MNIEEIKKGIVESINTKEALLSAPNTLDEISSIIEVCVSCLRQGGCIFLCGNGGSAADAQHIAAELTGRYYYDRPPLNAEALHTDTSFLTAVANDYGYEYVYARLLEGKAQAGDVLIAISTSGDSANLVNAVNKAREIGVLSIVFVGGDGGELEKICDKSICVPSFQTPRIQESHILIGHIVCEGIEKAIFPKGEF